MKKAVYWIFLPLFLISAVTFAERPIYKIGILLPITGADKAAGESINEGIEAFFSYMKESKGFETFLLKAVLYNTESKKENAEKIIQYLEKKTEDYLLLAGGLNDMEVNALVKLSSEKKIPYLFPLRVAFKEKHSQYTFPLFPSLAHGFKFLIQFFNEKKMTYKIVYDDLTRENAFTLTTSENLLDLNSKDFETQLAKVAIIYVDSSNVEAALKKIGNKSIRVFNYNQINLAQQSKEPALWESVLFLNWVKGEEQETVQFFKKYFMEKNKKEPDNYHMIGWMLADLIYSTVSKAMGKKNDKITQEELVQELESMGELGGYNEGCGYHIFYEPFAVSKEKSRLGISGVYFVQFTGGSFNVISDFYPLLN